MKILLEPTQKLFWTSDTHYGHKNLCAGVSEWKDKSRTRNYATLEDMNFSIVQSINFRVGENDILILMGDVALGNIRNLFEFIERLKCKNIHLFLGNHDDDIVENKNNCRSLFKSVNISGNVSVSNGGRHIWENRTKLSFECSHLPWASWNNMSEGSYHIHGHTHLSKEHKIGAGRHIDVGLEGNNFNVYETSEIMNLIGRKPIASLVLPFDHHVI